MKFGRFVVLIALVVASSPIVAPRLLAFPYHHRFGQHDVYSVAPLSPRLGRIIAVADRKVAVSPSGSYRAPDQTIVLTDGGWRWLWLANVAHGAFGFTRALNETVVLNRTDQARDVVYNGAVVGGVRSLDGVIAHEMTHGSLRAHFGLATDGRYPTALVEGYCDYVAGGGSLTDAQALNLIAHKQHHPALPYWLGRKQIAADLAKPGITLDSVFARQAKF